MFHPEWKLHLVASVLVLDYLLAESAAAEVFQHLRRG
jgi:hypothetical protein